MKFLEAPQCFQCTLGWGQRPMLSTSLAKICVYTKIYIYIYIHIQTYIYKHIHTHTHTNNCASKETRIRIPTSHSLPRNIHRSQGHFLKAQSRNDCRKGCHKILQFCFQSWWALCQGPYYGGERSHWPAVDPHRPVKLRTTSAEHMECRWARLDRGEWYLPLCHFPHHHPTASDSL